MKKSLVFAIIVSFPAVVEAQAIKPEPAMEQFTAEQTAAVEYPELSFEEDEGTVKSYKKYFYFHRDETSFDVAFHDITECDALASGIKFFSRADLTSSVVQYGAAGAIGGAIGSMMADAIFGSAERRKIRRVNIRRCMAFKGYDRYGLEKELWQNFHFEEGLSSVRGDKRRNYLLTQAKVASGPKPETEVLQP